MNSFLSFLLSPVGITKKTETRSFKKGSYIHGCSVTVTNQSIDHILQLDSASGASGEKDYRTWLFMFLHPRQDEPTTQKSSVPRLQTRPV